LGISSIAYNRASSLCSEIVDIATDDQLGNGIFSVHVKIKRRTYGEIFNLAYVLLADINFKYIFIYDDDIDIRNPKDRQWAFETRLQPKDGILTTPTIVGASLDPSGDENYFRHTIKAAFLCTKPWGKTDEEKKYVDRKFAKCWIPGVDKIDEKIWKK
jgi:UbiD family decarboxylase